MESDFEDAGPDPQTVRFGRVFLSCYGAGLVAFVLTAAIIVEISRQPADAAIVATDSHYNSAMVQQIQPYFPKSPWAR